MFSGAGISLGGIFAIIVLIGIIIALIVTNIRIVPQANAYVLERLGAYYATWQVGLHFKIPLIDKVARKVSLKEHVIDFPPQPVITKDNVTIEIDTVIYFQITDPKLYAYGVENPMAAIENLTATTLRNIIGELELDGTLTSREHINSKIRIVLDEATDAWGIKINRVEVKNINPPEDIQTAMEEGNKEAAILEAEATKQADIKEAEGKAEAIKMVQEATAEGLRMLSKAEATKEVLTLRSLEAFEKAADGKATKIIIPAEIQGMAGLASALTGIVVDGDGKPKKYSLGAAGSGTVETDR